MRELPTAGADARAGPLESIRSADGREIVDWRAGSPIFAGDPPSSAEPACPAPRGTAWILKPGDIVCDWLKVKEADNRGLLRMVVNLTLYAKLGAAIAFVMS